MDLADRDGTGGKEEPGVASRVEGQGGARGMTDHSGANRSEARAGAEGSTEQGIGDD